MTAKEISDNLVAVMMGGTNDVATLRKIKAMGERLEQRIIDYAKEKCKDQRARIHTYQLLNHGAVTADVKDSIHNAPEPKFD